MISLCARLAAAAGRLNAAVALTIVYYAVLTPAAWLWRLLGADPLDLRTPRDSYWRPYDAGD